MNWSEKETFWILQVKQRSNEWYRARYGRCTTSLFSACIGESPYMTPDKALRVIKQEEEPEMNFAMQQGINLEPEARRQYENVRRTTVQEIGLAVPKWNVYIAASTDGLVDEDGIIEIKCPVKYHRNLELLRNSTDFKGLIDPVHYLQMQGGMAILNRQWCDYIVYYKDRKKMFIYRVPFDQEYWNEKYQKIKQFIESERIDKLQVLLPNNPLQSQS